MKIGEFARKHNVTIDAVRHYISEGLLTPLKINTQYDFSETDEDVLETILLLKSMNFKLEEMRPYLLFQTIYTQNSFSYLGDFEEEFRKKMRKNQEEIERLTKMNRQIEKQLAKSRPIKVHRGTSLVLLSELFCPNCDRNLELEEPDILHNEILSGKLRCPKCGKLYHVRHGIISDEPIEIEYDPEGTSDSTKLYLQTSTREYVVAMMEQFAEMQHRVYEHSRKAKTVFLDGQSASYLDSAIIRRIPEDCTLVVQSGWYVLQKFFCEEILPEKFIFYSGKRENFPVKMTMDYVVCEQHDIDYFDMGTFEMYPNIADGAKIDCLKILFENEKGLLDEEAYIREMANRGWTKVKDFKTACVINKKESMDLSDFNKTKDIHMRYALYTFQKTLG